MFKIRLSAAIEITILSFISSGEELNFDHLKVKLMIDELNDLEKARILFHWITAQRFDAKAWFLIFNSKSCWFVESEILRL